MGLIKTSGIVFKVTKYRETSIITDIYTRELGLRSYIVNGVRKPKSSFPAALFQIGNLVELIVYEKHADRLNRIKEAKPLFIYREIPFDIKKSSVHLFIIELMSKCIKEHESNYPLFDFLDLQLRTLDGIKTGTQYFHLVFLVGFSAYLGFQPLNNYQEEKSYFNLREGMFDSRSNTMYHIDHEKSKYLSAILDIGVEDIDQLDIPKPIRLALIEDLIKYYQYHVEGFQPLKSYEIYRQMF